MTESGGHPGDALHLLLDKRLPADRQAAVEAHLRSCGRCRRELAGLRRLKTVLREALPEHGVPPGLAAGVTLAIAREAVPVALRRRWVLGPRRVAAIGLSLAAAAAVLALVLVRSGRQDVVAHVAQDVALYRNDRLALQIATADPSALERFFARGRIPFRIRVWDFGMMGYRLKGGRVHQVAGRVSALFAYEGPGGSSVVCQMYQGALSELPPGGEEREHDGIRFRIHRAAGLTLVFWEEGSMVCVLAADGDPEEAVALAFAKAERV